MGTNLIGHILAIGQNPLHAAICLEAHAQVGAEAGNGIAIRQVIAVEGETFSTEAWADWYGDKQRAVCIESGELDGLPHVAAVDKVAELLANPGIVSIPLAFLLGDFNSEADVRGEGYDLILRSGWQDTYRLARQRDDGYTVVQAIDGWRDAPDAAAKKRIDQIWCSREVTVKSSRVVFGGLQEPQVSDHAGVLIEL